jgi:deoxyribonuclease V
MWPGSARELMDAQRLLATAQPPPWQPSSVEPVVGACVVRFPRGQAGRVVAEALVTGKAGGPMNPAYSPCDQRHCA